MMMTTTPTAPLNSTLSDTARRTKFPLTYTYVAGLLFDRPEWAAYTLGMTEIVRQGSAGELLQGDVRRHFDRVLLKLGGGA